MKIGDRIIIVNGRHEHETATVLNVLDFDKVIVRIDGIDIAVGKRDYVKIGGTNMGNQVIVYSKNNCTPCILIKNFLNERDVPFEERNISTNEAYVTELIEMGVNGVPVLIVNGEIITNTYDFEKLEEILHGGGVSQE